MRERLDWKEITTLGCRKLKMQETAGFSNFREKRPERRQGDMSSVGTEVVFFTKAIILFLLIL